MVNEETSQVLQSEDSVYFKLLIQLLKQRFGSDAATPYFRWIDISLGNVLDKK